MKFRWETSELQTNATGWAFISPIQPHRRHHQLGSSQGGQWKHQITSVRASYCAEECKEVEKEEFREFEAKRRLGLEEKQLRRKQLREEVPREEAEYPSFRLFVRSFVRSFKRSFVRFHFHCSLSHFILISFSFSLSSHTFIFISYQCSFV